MKTKKLEVSRKYRFESILTIAGWALAVFVSFLYLREVNQPELPPAQSATSAVVPGPSSQRVTDLLAEAHSSLSRHQPEQAIYKITTLWSVCHASREEVPEESHRLFAKAVSDLTEHPPRPPHAIPRVRSVAPEQKPARALTRDSVEVSPSSPKANLNLPEQDYPTAKHERATRPPHPPIDIDRAPPPFPPAGPESDSAPNFPPPPPNRHADGRFPGPPPRRDRTSPRGRRTPPNAAQADSFPAPPPRAKKRAPLEAREQDQSIPGY